MKKSIIVVVSALVLFGCKKKAETDYSAGSVEGMSVVSHDFSIKGIAEDPDNYQKFFSIDLDGDGANDVKFVSFADSIMAPTETISWHINMTILNDNFSFLEIPNSGWLKEERYPGESGYYGTYPVEVDTINYTCVNSDGVAVSNHGNNPVVFGAGDVIEPAGYNWDNYLSTMQIASSGYLTEYSGLNEGFDTLLKVVTKRPSYCQGVEGSGPYYMPYRKIQGDFYFRGWIEIAISEGNRLTISRSAMSTETFDL